MGRAVREHVKQQQEGRGVFVSYASNFEDVILQRVFRDKNDGFYIDIGADHPTGASVTKAFYDRGWRGVNIEPGPHFDLLEKARSRDINLQAVVTDRDGTVDFYVHEGLTATSSILESIDEAVQTRIQARTKIEVRSYTLNTIVRDHAQGPIDFLKIDAEGAEGMIINATDWATVRPTVILAESTEAFSNKRIDGVWSAVLARNGFLPVYFDGINSWFVREEDSGLANLFACPVNVLDDFVDYEKLALRREVEALRQGRAKPKAHFPGILGRFKWWS